MQVIIEPFFYCLLASMIWAPIVFLISSKLNKQDTPALADKLWPSALLIAALPALFAPVAAALGLSLRNPAPLPPMGAPTAITDYAPVAISTPRVTAEPAMGLADILTTAAGLYFYGFILFLMLGIVRMVWFSYRVGFSYDLDEPRLEAGFEEWRTRIGIKRPPRYAFTYAVSSVCVHGFFRPVILLPMSLLDRVSVNDAILMGAHEMAHIKRGDTWLFAFITAVKAVFWFNPFVHRIAARANLAAEQAADALVITSGASRRQYAQCFVEGLRFAVGSPRADHALVPSFTPFDKRSRRERLDAILSRAGGSPMLSVPNKIGMTLSIVAAAGLAFAQAALAVAPKPPGEALPQSPVEGEVTFGFGKKSKALGAERPQTHEGIDLRAPKGTTVRAAGDGKIVAATNRYKGQPAWGNVVVIDHGHGLITRYAHLDRYVVKKGDYVKAGKAIGAVGSTGKSSGPHLHFEVIQDGIHIDPAPVIAAEPMPAPRPMMKPARAITITPAPAIAIAPMPPTIRSDYHPEEDAGLDPEFDEKLEKRLAGKFRKLDKQLREQFNNFDAFVDMNDFEFDFDDAEIIEEITEQMNEMNFDFGELNDFQLEMPEIASMGEMLKWSDEDRAEVRRVQEEAQREVKRAMKEVKRELKHAERERETAKREREYERRYDREESEREREEALEEARMHQIEMLDLREEALREAERDLKRERAELDRMRAELEREKRKGKNK